MRKRKGFTLAELITAVAILAMVAGFVSVIFKSSIDGYRSAGANTEIMQKLRAITEQLNSDFEGLCKDGYLIIRKDLQNKRPVYKNNPDETKDVYMDRIYYFATGDFQSWDDPAVKSNIARVLWGQDFKSLFTKITPLSECKLARDVLLLTQGAPVLSDSNNISFSECKSNLSILEDFEEVLGASIDLSDVNNFRSFMCENIGEFKIDWSEGHFDLTGDLIWLPQGTTSFEKIWKTNDPKPKALKFTFTLYDSRGILDGGRRFSHIVYIGD